MLKQLTTSLEGPRWYLVRTKPHKERWVRDQLSSSVGEVFLPLLRTRRPQWGRPSPAIIPLFPCYLFARFDLRLCYFDVKYTPGVQALVSAGREPLVVAESIIEDIKLRGPEGVVELSPKALTPGQRVRVVDGPFRGFEAIFERYLSGAERVAILLEAIRAQGVRVVMPTGFLSELD